MRTMRTLMNYKKIKFAVSIHLLILGRLEGSAHNRSPANHLNDLFSPRFHLNNPSDEESNYSNESDYSNHNTPILSPSNGENYFASLESPLVQRDLSDDQYSDNDDIHLLNEAEQVLREAERVLQECKNDSESNSSYSTSSSILPPNGIIKFWRKKEHEIIQTKQKKYNAANIIKRNIKRKLLIKSLPANIMSIRHAAVIGAIKDNDAQELQRLIQDKKCPVQAENKTAIILACDDTKAPCLEVLLKNHADPNFKDEKGNSILYLASYNGDDTCALLLKKAGAEHTPVTHLGRKVGDTVPLDYFKNHTIDNALMRAHKKTNSKK